MSVRSTLRCVFAVCLAAVVFASLLPPDSDACPRLFPLFRKRVEYHCPSQVVPAPATPLPVALRQWPMFGGTPQRNMINLVEKNLPTSWSVEKNKNIKWVAELGSRAYGGPVIAGGRIFVGTNNQNPRDKTLVKDGKPIDLGVLMCFRESDGGFLWQAVHEKLPIGRIQDWPLQGICSTPAVEGERLYYVSNRCELVCADVNDGKAIWLLDMIDVLGVFPHNMSACSPLIVDDRIYVVTANGVDGSHLSIPAPAAPSFLAVDKKTGKVVWQNNAPTAKLVDADKNNASKQFTQLANRGEVVMHGQWSNPAYAIVNGQPQVIFPGGDGWIYSFTPDGELLWKFDCNPKDAKYRLGSRGTRNPFVATPVIHKNRVYIGVGDDPEFDTGEGHFWCIDMTKRGDVSSEFLTHPVGELPKVIPNPASAMVWHFGGEIKNKQERAKLKRLWYFGRTLSTCAIHDGLAYVADLGGWVHCLDADTGKVHWTHDAYASIWSSPYLVDGKIYLGTEDDFLVFEHGKQKKLLAKIEMEGRVRSTPAAANGVLYVSTENRLYAIAQK